MLFESFRNNIYEVWCYIVLELEGLFTWFILMLCTACITISCADSLRELLSFDLIMPLQTLNTEAIPLGSLGGRSHVEVGLVTRPAEGSCLQ